MKHFLVLCQQSQGVADDFIFFLAHVGLQDQANYMKLICTQCGWVELVGLKEANSQLSRTSFIDHC